MILLDTHVVIWWATGPLEHLSNEARVALEAQEDAAAGGGLVVSAISCWEVAILTQRGRLALTMEVDHWLRWPLVCRSPSTPIPPIAYWSPGLATLGFP